MMQDQDPFPARTRYIDPEVAGSYDARREGPIRWLELRCVSRALDSLEPGGTILDIPCGTGRFTALLAQRFRSVQGIDISDRMLARANERLAGLSRVQLSRGDAAELPFARDTFDYCLSMRFFGHTPPDVRRAVFRELARVTSRRLLLTLYVRDPLIRLRKRVESALGKRVGGPWYAYPSTEAATRDLEEAGLKVIRVEAVLPYVLEARLFIAERA